ncbi:hypothetical protein Goari_012182 [Gossypium aridum]|uniref:Uncharacterized protein n=1 Tax=Gossypium aridum TaxID=34290 RepID=A0A7J8X052_GOSAI|nr:hypothetical protein [Gossypium aridum]
MGDLCHIKVELDVQKPLRRGIFILAALKAESNLIRKVSIWLGVTMKKSMPQCYYLGRYDEGREGNTNFDTEKDKDKVWYEDKREHNGEVLLSKSHVKDIVEYSGHSTWVNSPSAMKMGQTDFSQNIIDRPNGP